MRHLGAIPISKCYFGKSHLGRDSNLQVENLISYHSRSQGEFLYTDRIRIVLWVEGLKRAPSILSPIEFSPPEDVSGTWADSLRGLTRPLLLIFIVFVWN
jgi:hypothetical protein